MFTLDFCWTITSTDKYASKIISQQREITLPGRIPEHNLQVLLLPLDTCIQGDKFLHFLYGSLLEWECLHQWYSSIQGHMTLLVPSDWSYHNTFHQYIVDILIHQLVRVHC